jgi:hypothetical protein
MAGTAPTFYKIANTPNQNGVGGGDAWKAIYNLFLAIYYFCYNVDDDAGTVDSDYASKISTPLLLAIAGAGGTAALPLGAADSTVGNYYTPSNVMSPEGMSQADVLTTLYDIWIALYVICAKADLNAGGALDTNFRALISTPLTATLGSKLAVPAEGLISGTYFYGMESYMDKGCFTQGDFYKCLYNLYIAIVRICTIFDAGAGTLPATLLAGVGTPLNTAMGQFIIAPNGGDTEVGT